MTSTRDRRSTLKLLLLASVTVSFLAGSSAPTPLYAHYASAFSFTPITTTVIFAIYAVVLLAALLSAGRLSDHLGRRPVILAGIAGQFAAMIVFAEAGGVGDLLAARVIQGISTGAALGAVGAAMLDLDRVRGTVTNTVAPPIGTAAGALLSALAVQLLPAPTQLIYLVLAGVLAVQAAGVLAISETSPRTPGALRSLRPRVSLPRVVRAPLRTAGPVMFAAWALAGFYASLSPSLIATLTRSPSVVLGGLGLFVLAAVAAVAGFILRDTAAQDVMLIGIVGLLAGVTSTLLAVALGSPLLFFAGTTAAGVGFGSAFQGGIRSVVPLALEHERAGVLSLVYIVSYLGFGIPAVIAGFLVVDLGGLTQTTYEYGAGIVLLTAVAAVRPARRRLGLRTERAHTEPVARRQPTAV
jgi:predicted MFS family arabinose efflux permease